MYEPFGFGRWADDRLGFKLFVPDHAIDPSQYTRGDRCKIVGVRVVGDFQTAVDPGATNWDAASGLQMRLQPHANGLLFTAALPADFPGGYFQYKDVVNFENGIGALGRRPLHEIWGRPTLQLGLRRGWQTHCDHAVGAREARQRRRFGLVRADDRRLHRRLPPSGQDHARAELGCLFRQEHEYDLRHVISGVSIMVTLPHCRGIHHRNVVIHNALKRPA